MDDGHNLSDGPTGESSLWSNPGSPSTEISSNSLAATAATRAPVGYASKLAVGTTLAGRYEMLTALGSGGMGSVYKARDLELDRLVALKVIKPELSADPAMVQRFKQELILARQVTHRNVVRIYDLGEGAGMKFITMEFIQGRDLYSVLKSRGKLPPDEAAGVMQQICRGLEAAHAEKVIHRDLKPQNVMVEENGRIVVMDFGLARSTESIGMTRTGMLMGTLEYMSPEQALGQDLDARSDVFSAGLIFYELLTGKLPYHAESAVGRLLKRTQEPAQPASEVNPAVPLGISTIVSKCLERDRNLRYQSATEMVRDLDSWTTGISPAAATGSFGAARVLTLKRIIMAALVVALAGAVALERRAIFGWATSSKATAPQSVSVAILPFHNSSGDATLDWLGTSVASVLGDDVGQSAHLRLVSQERLQQVLKDLKVAPRADLDPNMTNAIAEFSSADTVVSGSYARLNGQIRIEAVLRDVKSGRSVSLPAETHNESELLNGLGALAVQIRKNLTLPHADARELAKQSFVLSKSVEAVRLYEEGMDLMRQGNNLEAQKRLEAALEQDNNFAIAYSVLGLTYSNLGYDDRAERASERAVALSGPLPAREKYLILANQSQVTNDHDKAIEYYENLAKASPQDLDVQFTLAKMYEAAGDLDNAFSHVSTVLEHDANNVDALLASGRIEIKRGNPEHSIDPLAKALSLAVRFDNQEEKANILQAMGVAYKRLGKLDEALNDYQQSLEIKRKIGQKGGEATSLNEIAQVEARLGQYNAANASYQDALAIRRQIGDKRGIGDTLIDFGTLLVDRGREDDAVKMSREALQIERELGNQQKQALCLNNMGNALFRKSLYADALTDFQQSLDLRLKGGSPRDLADSEQNIAESNLKLGDYDAALQGYLRALESYRKAQDPHGEAVEAYSIGTLLGVQGRYSAALKSKQDALAKLQSLQDRTFWMAEVTEGTGYTLAELGHRDEAEQMLAQGISIARQLNNDGLVSQGLVWQGEAARFMNDTANARVFYTRALESATKSQEADKILISKVKLAEVSASSGGAGAIPSLRHLADQSEAMGLKNLAVEARLALGEALLRGRNLAAAGQELEHALARAQKLGMRAEQARAHALLGRSSDPAEAAQQYSAAMKIWSEMDAEFLKRPDVALLYSEAVKHTRNSPPS